MPVGNIEREEAPDQNAAEAWERRDAAAGTKVWEGRRRSLPPQDRPPFKWVDEVMLEQERHGPIPDHYMERGTPPDDEALTVETSVFTSKAYHDLEVKALWSSVWQLACHVSDVPHVGDFLEYEIAGRSIIVVRSAADEIKALNNSCMHRGTLLASGGGHKTEFQCPFHGWAYALDGRLIDVPHAWDFPHVDPDSCGIKQYAVGEWDGWVFISLDPNPMPFADFVGDVLTRHFQHATLSCQNRFKPWHVAQVVEANWKVVLDAFIETYHVLKTHPQVCLGAGEAQGLTDIFGLHSRQLNEIGIPAAGLDDGIASEQDVVDCALTMIGVQPGSYEWQNGQLPQHVVADAIRDSSRKAGFDVDELSDTELLAINNYHVFPNVIIAGSSPLAQVFRFRPLGDDPNRSLFEVWAMAIVPPGVERPTNATVKMLNSDQTWAKDAPETGWSIGVALDQDVRNCQNIHRGQLGMDKVILSRHQEAQVRNFHNNLTHWIADHSETESSGAAMTARPD